MPTSGHLETDQRRTHCRQHRLIYRRDYTAFMNLNAAEQRRLNVPVNPGFNLLKVRTPLASNAD